MTSSDHAQSARRATARLTHVSKLWQSYLEAERLPQLDRWLAHALKQQRQFGKRDRRAYSELLFSAVRFGYLAAYLDFVRERIDPRARTGLGAALAEAAEAFGRLFAQPDAALKALRRMPPERLFQLVGYRYRAEPSLPAWPLTGAPSAGDEAMLERLFEGLAALRESSPELWPRLLWAGIPLAFEPALAQRAARSAWDQDALNRFLDAHARRPPLWLRLNRPERRDEVLEEFRRAGFEVSERLGALRIEGERSVYELDAFEDGAFEIQDLASQLIGAACAAEPGQLVWDACAGGGGKTMQLAAALRNRGAVYASDIREYKLKEVRRRAARARFDNVRTFVWQGEALAELPREVAKQGGFHWVLVDAPCSSSGTWRRNPDARFRADPSAVAELADLQLRLLEAAAPAVRPGGRLVYATCSWLTDENEAVVERFLAKWPGFRLERQALHGNPYEDSDTMFSASLHRFG